MADAENMKSTWLLEAHLGTLTLALSHEKLWEREPEGRSFI
jgi:hypothetical protein